MKTSKKPYQAIVLLTGGMDSTVLLDHVNKIHSNILALHFKTGLQANKFENRASKSIAKNGNVDIKYVNINRYLDKFELTNLSEFAEEPMFAQYLVSTIFSMTTAIALKNRIPKIYVAFHKEDGKLNPEASSEYLSYLNKGFKITQADCEIIAPFITQNKSDILKLGISYESPLEKSWTCISPNRGEHCGKCINCKSRKEAYNSMNIKDVVEYA